MSSRRRKRTREEEGQAVRSRGPVDVDQVLVRKEIAESDRVALRAVHFLRIKCSVSAVLPRTVDADKRTSSNWYA